MTADELSSVEIASVLSAMTRDVCRDLLLWLGSQRDLGALDLPVDAEAWNLSATQPAVRPMTAAQPSQPSQLSQPVVSHPVPPVAPAPKPSVSPVSQPRAESPVSQPAASASANSAQMFSALRHKVAKPSFNTAEERRHGLDTLNARISACRQCPLGNARRGVLCGYGPADASLMFVAAGGNPRELDKGRILTDDAAALFDKIVAAMATLDAEASPDRIYMTNLIKCAAVPPRGKGPDVARCCLGMLRQEVRIISPKVIVIWGELALKAMFGGDLGISQARGKWQNFEGVAAIATHHPIEMLKNPMLKGRVWGDLQNAVARLKEL